MKTRLLLLPLFPLLVLLPANDPVNASPSTDPTLAAAVAESRREMRLADDATDAWTARNDKHGLSARFSPDGLALSVDVAGRAEADARLVSTWRTTRIGFGETPAPLTAGAVVRDSESPARIEIRREGLVEWFVNLEEGLEHGYTLSRRPRGSGGGLPLRLELALEGDLAVEVTACGRHAILRDESGKEVLRYENLKVWDATGRDLSARLDGKGRALAFEIEEASAVYPITIDPVFSQSAFLKSSNSDPGDRFGSAVAASGNLVAVGAPLEGGGATGINGPDDNLGAGSGAVYVFTRNGLAWTETAYLKPSSNPSSNIGYTPHRFGSALAFSGNTLVVGAPGESSSSPGVGGDETNSDASDSGAAYVFVVNNGVWTQQAYLKASNPGAGDAFGSSVAISGDTIVVGAPLEDSSAVLVNGIDNDDALDSGAAYVYGRSNGTWTFSTYLKPFNTDPGDQFGFSVAVHGNGVLVGAPFEDSAASTVQGDETDDTATDAGAAYYFARLDTDYWVPLGYLKPFNTDAGDRFGSAVAIHGNVAVVGAPFESGNSKGIDGPDNNAGLFNGAAYVFTLNVDIWSQGSYLKSPNTRPSDGYGHALAISADRLLVSARGEWSSATGVDGDMDNADAYNSGAAYLYARNGASFSLLHYLKASNTTIQNEFGQSVALAPRIAVVGTGFDDAPSRGVGASQVQDADPANNSGAAYIFYLPLPAKATLTGPARFPKTRVRKRSRPRVARIANLGEANLTGLRAGATGKARRDFRLVGPVSRTVAGGASTTMRAFFRPTRNGVRRAVLTVRSNVAPLRRPLFGRGR